MSDQSRRPLWKRRTVFSDKRNVSIVLWPGWEFKPGEPGSPNIAIQESRRKGPKEAAEWENISIYITLDKAPKILVDLQLAYLKAIELEEGEGPPTAPVIAPTRPQAQPTLAGRILKLVSEEHRVSGDVITLAQQFNTTQDAVRDAVQKLQEKGFITIEVEGLRPFLVPAK